MTFKDVGLAPDIEWNLRASQKAQAGSGAVKDRRRGRCGSDDGQGCSIGKDSPSLQVSTA